MRSRLDANQMLLLANCARSIEHSRARGLVHWAADRIMDRITYGVSVEHQERGVENGEKIQIDPSFHVCLFTYHFR
jgi:hypothetical protein